MSRIYSTSRTHEDYKWPRWMQLCEKPAQPPVRTGVRLLWPDPDSRLCKHGIYEDYVQQQRSNRSKKTEKDDDCVLMSRDKYMRLNKKFKFKRYVDDMYKLISTYQIYYVHDKLAYDYMMDRADKMSSQPKQICILQKGYVDPIKFKKKNDEEPLIS